MVNDEERLREASCTLRGPIISDRGAVASARNARPKENRSAPGGSAFPVGRANLRAARHRCHPDRRAGRWDRRPLGRETAWGHCRGAGSERRGGSFDAAQRARARAGGSLRRAESNPALLVELASGDLSRQEVTTCPNGSVSKSTSPRKSLAWMQSSRSLANRRPMPAPVSRRVVAIEGRRSCALPLPYGAASRPRR